MYFCAMKWIFAAIFLMFLPQIGAEQQLDEAGVAFALPSNAWHLADRNEGRGLVIYSYKREPVEDMYGRKIIANISVLTELVGEGLDVQTFSAKIKARAPFSILENLPLQNNLNFNNAIAYKGSFTDNNGFRHVMYVFHIRHRNKGTQVILDVPESVATELEPEFERVLNSLRLI